MVTCSIKREEKHDSPSIKFTIAYLKKNLFLVTNTKETLDNETIAQKYYWEILNKHCKDFIP